MHTCVSLCFYACECRCPERSEEGVDLEVNVVMSCSKWVLATELGSPIRVVSAFKRWDISPPPASFCRTGKESNLPVYTLKVELPWWRDTGSRVVPMCQKSDVALDLANKFFWYLCFLHHGGKSTGHWTTQLLEFSPFWLPGINL